jgi:predicted transcriptional regulator
MEHKVMMLREEILKLMFNENSMKILNRIIENHDTDGTTLLITKLGLTRKQFYSKLYELITNGLIKKERGSYHITTLGKIVYDMTAEYKKKLDSIVEDYWKFKALDFFNISDEFTNEEKDKITHYIFNKIKTESSAIDLSITPERCPPPAEYLQKNQVFKN